MGTLANGFLDSLHADGPSADRADKMALYGWLIGDWTIDYTEFLPDGTQRSRPGEWHFGWVLEGRAVQDVWIVPPRGSRHPDDATAHGDYYGTTLRVYDPRIDAWQVQYADPVAQVYLSMVGRREGDAIVQFGVNQLGQTVRWSFSDMTPNSFLWRGEYSLDDGATWRPRTHFYARRVVMQ
jgi:hypothetical protein